MLLQKFADSLIARGLSHDFSKTLPPELELFAELHERFMECKYGSDEYKECCDRVRPAIDHHYAVNSHHPEHYKNGLAGMNLLDLIEMVCDWKAAGERHGNFDLTDLINKNAVRFEMCEQLRQIVLNTVDFLEMDDSHLSEVKDDTPTT